MLNSVDSKAWTTTRVNGGTDSTGSTTSAISLTSGNWYTARVVDDDAIGDPTHQRLRFWVDTDQDNPPDFSDETTLIDDTSIDDTWSGGLVGLYRGQENTTVHKFDDFQFGIDDADADFDIDDFLVSDNFTSAAVSPAHDTSGNLTDDGVYNYTYDAWNRLRKVRLVAEGDTTVVQEATWLPDGRLAGKTITNSGSQHLPNDGGNVTLHYYCALGHAVEDRNGSNQTLRRLRCAPIRLRLLTLAFGACPLLASGCDPQVQASIRSALESSTTTLLNALLDAALQTLEPDEEPPITTV